MEIYFSTKRFRIIQRSLELNCEHSDFSTLPYIVSVSAARPGTTGLDVEGWVSRRVYAKRWDDPNPSVIRVWPQGSSNAKKTSQILNLWRHWCSASAEHDFILQSIWFSFNDTILKCTTAPLGKLMHRGKCHSKYSVPQCLMKKEHSLKSQFVPDF